MNLEELNLAEWKLFARVESLNGLMEEKFLQLQREGTFAEYGKIYEAYVALIESEIEGLEALKRAIFLLWYEQAEPACFTGIWGLSESASDKVLTSLEARIEADSIDLELRWMLPYYNSIANWVFERPARLTHLKRFLVAPNKDLWMQELKAENFIDRGHMGIYWVSVSE